MVATSRTYVGTGVFVVTASDKGLKGEKRELLSLFVILRGVSLLARDDIRVTHLFTICFGKRGL